MTLTKELLARDASTLVRFLRRGINDGVDLLQVKPPDDRFG